MATRSTIAFEHADGTVSMVYCHWDGYLEHNGSILLKHWSDADKLRQLMEQGDLSSLGKEIGEVHPFDNPHPYGSSAWKEFKETYRDQCTFYGRDRGEEGVAARVYRDFAEYQASPSFEEYNYILRTDGVWRVAFGYFYGTLEQAFAETASQDE